MAKKTKGAFEDPKFIWGVGLGVLAWHTFVKSNVYGDLDFFNGAFVLKNEKAKRNE